MLNRGKKGTPAPKISERFYRGISLPAQLLALAVDAALAHDTLRRALSGSDESISILVAVSIAAVIVECSSQAAVKRTRGEQFASRALLGFAFAIATIIFVLRVTSGVGSGVQTASAFATQTTSWTEYLTNAMISLLQSACVCATIISVYYTRVSDIKSRDCEELLEHRGEQEARRLSPDAYDVEHDIEAAEDYVAAVYARAGSVVISRAALLSPDIADVYELSARQNERAVSALVERHRGNLHIGSQATASPTEGTRRHMADAA